MTRRALFRLIGGAPLAGRAPRGPAVAGLITRGMIGTVNATMIVPSIPASKIGNFQISVLYPEPKAGGL